MSGNVILLFIVLFPMLAAVGCYLTCRFWQSSMRDGLAILIGGAELLVVLLFAVSSFGENAAYSLSGICSLGLNLMMDDFRRIYAVVIGFMWFMTLLFSKQYFRRDENRARYYLFNLLTLGGTMGVFLSADLYTTFVFFEMISFTSYAWVAHEESAGALKAAATYLAVAVIGGLVALMGLFLLQNTLGTLVIDQLYSAAAVCGDKTRLYVAGGCLLFGFGAKAGIYPLHIWLPKAHPVAPAPASALLSGILTKCGVFGVLAVSCSIFRNDPDWGVLLLILGVITMVFGALLALFSVDLKRTLACSSMSQIGFIVVGIGMMCLLGEANALAARGTMLHMVNHSLFKLVLFMAAGTVYMNLHKLDLNAIRGFGRNKPLLHFVFLMGALGIAGVPLWSGYISKTLLHESIVEYAAIAPSTAITVVEWLFLTAGGLTLGYMAKLYVAIFVEKHPTRQQEFDGMKKYMTRPTAVALVGSAVVLPVLGTFPHQTMDRLAAAGVGFFAGAPLDETVRYFSLTNLRGAAISVLIGAAVYFLVVRRLLMREGAYVDRLTYKYDLEDHVYRPLLLRVLPQILGWVAAVFGDNRLLTPVFQKLLRGGGAEMCALTSPGGAAIEEEIPYDDNRNKLTYKIGALLDKGYTAAHKAPPAHRMSTTLVRLFNALGHGTSKIVRNLSFSLLMVCVGLCLLLVYMLLIRR